MRRKPAESLRPAALLALGLSTALACAGAVARTSDRNQPLDVEATSTDCTVAGDGPCSFTGNVHLTQGTLLVQAAKAVVHRSNGDIRRVILTGAPAQMSQELDDGSTVTGRASNVDYDMSTDTVVFTGNAVIDQRGGGNITAGRISYNMKSGQVQGSGGEGPGRVHVKFPPKTQQGTR
ncbi:lipopolysaccharide export system protein LptA [Lysobacter helvus]|uniref:Lipopolysaccharide export system protein LptA n=2 Tax=Lysobacteraceae TaxID=32033 RepID=A0ABM7Q644_9GAMM|nr:MULTISPECIES: lipopolysaccharide transport periplasmic protein LptA [Lysobacter]BCT92835.1 lipopolysaccharide export system protein LptA [Lysobacter caseinilyticus]BCT95988.1 lipopolysaccharide export system protein LptA [Lysobacter helvus]